MLAAGAPTTASAERLTVHDAVRGCALRSGDWCLRLSWPGTPVTSFRWGRVVTINVSPGGAAGPARRDAPRRSSKHPVCADGCPGARRERTSLLSCNASCGQPVPSSVAATSPSLHACGQPSPGSVADASHRPPATPYARTTEPARRRERTSDGEYGPRGRRPRAFRCVLASRAPRPARLPPPTGTFHAAGCVSFRAGAFDAVRDSNPVPARAGCPRPHRNVPARAGRPQPRRLSAGPPWHPEPLVRQLHQRRRPTTTSGPHTDARSGQAEEGATGSKRGSSQT